VGFSHGFLYSKSFHSLVHHALSNGSSSDAESKEEALAVYQDICEIIENQAKVKEVSIRHSNILSIGTYAPRVANG